jgi:hypothetical protein
MAGSARFEKAGFAQESLELIDCRAVTEDRQAMNNPLANYRRKGKNGAVGYGSLRIA